MRVFLNVGGMAMKTVQNGKGQKEMVRLAKRRLDAMQRGWRKHPMRRSLSVR